MLPRWSDWKSREGKWCDCIKCVVLIYLCFTDWIHRANGTFTGKPQTKTSHRCEIHRHCLYQCPRSCCDKRALLQETHKKTLFYAHHFLLSSRCILQMVERLQKISKNFLLFFLRKEKVVLYRSSHPHRCFCNRRLPNRWERKYDFPQTPGEVWSLRRNLTSKWIDFSSLVLTEFVFNTTNSSTSADTGSNHTAQTSSSTCPETPEENEPSDMFLS